jgi:hypothetical protein
MRGEFEPNQDGNYEFVTIEAPEYEVNNFEDYMALCSEMFRIATEDYPGIIPIFKVRDYNDLP